MQLFEISIFTEGTDKIHLRAGHEGPEREHRYSSTLSLTLALDGVDGKRHAPAALPPEKRPGIHLTEGTELLKPERSQKIHTYSDFEPSQKMQGYSKF
jgi:hypothetical protein